MIYRFKKNRCGRTPYQLVIGHQSNGPIAPFGEMVSFRMADGKPHVRKEDRAWKRGAFIGMADRSNQAFVLSEEGMRACRTVRKVAPDQRWNPDFLLAMEWTVPQALYGEQDPPPEELPSNRGHVVPRRVNPDIPQVTYLPPVRTGMPIVQIDEDVEVSDEEAAKKQAARKAVV